MAQASFHQFQAIRFDIWTLYSSQYAKRKREEKPVGTQNLGSGSQIGLGELCSKMLCSNALNFFDYESKN